MLAATEGGGALTTAQSHYASNTMYHNSHWRAWYAPAGERGMVRSVGGKAIAILRSGFRGAVAAERSFLPGKMLSDTNSQG